VCSVDGKVKYQKDSIPSTILSIRIPKEMLPPKEQVFVQESDKESGHLSNGDEGEKTEKKDEDKQQPRESKRQKSVEAVVPTISFQTCLDVFHEQSTIDDYNWPHLNNQSFKASVQTGLENFPKYLFVQLLRYELGPNWIPVKIEVNVDVPEYIDLSFLKMSSAPKKDEELVPSEKESGNTNGSSGALNVIGSQNMPSFGRVAVDEFALSQLMDMGFSLNGCTRALLAAGGSDVETAMNWIFEHNMDPNFNDPLPDAGSTDNIMDVTTTIPSSNTSRISAYPVDDTVVSSLVESLGCFTFDQVKASLIAAGGAMDRAADWLFSHIDDLDTAIAQLGTNATSAVLQEERQTQPTSSDKAIDIALDDGEGMYSLIGCVSHIGKNVGSGHYVCHLKKDGKWIIYNDEKVAISQTPPLQHAYLYLFRRDDATMEAT
jgi:ubiquitin carboxyl-terminal hydrolase 5/13